MAHDYAKQSLKKSKPQKKGRKRHIGLFFVALIATAVLVAAIIYLSQQRMEHHQLFDSATKHKNLSSRRGQKTDLDAKQDDKEINFDFYTILPKIKVKPDLPKKSEQVKKPAAEKYMLYISTVNDALLAGQWKVKLISLGFNARIEEDMAAGEKRYKIMAGPYADRSKADQAQARLRENDILSDLQIIRLSKTR